MVKVKLKGKVEVGEDIKSKRNKKMNKMVRNIIQNKLKILKMKKKIPGRRKRLKLMKSNQVVKNIKHNQDLYMLKSNKIKII